MEPPTDYLKGGQKNSVKNMVCSWFSMKYRPVWGAYRIFVCLRRGKGQPGYSAAGQALSGGVIPHRGACLSNDKAYHKDFALKHSSTFAGNTTACRAGIRSLEMLLRNDMEIINAARSTGDYLKNKLLLLKEKYPDIIGEIRGRGPDAGHQF